MPKQGGASARRCASRILFLDQESIAILRVLDPCGRATAADQVARSSGRDTLPARGGRLLGRSTTTRTENVFSVMPNSATLVRMSSTIAWNCGTCSFGFLGQSFHLGFQFLVRCHVSLFRLSTHMIAVSAESFEEISSTTRFVIDKAMQDCFEHLKSVSCMRKCRGLPGNFNGGGTSL